MNRDTIALITTGLACKARNYNLQDLPWFEDLENYANYDQDPEHMALPKKLQDGQYRECVAFLANCILLRFEERLDPENSLAVSGDERRYLENFIYYYGAGLQTLVWEVM